MTNEQLISAIIGLAVSLTADYMPGIRSWFEKLTPPQKVAFVLIINLAAVIGLAIYQGGWSWQVVANAVTAWIASISAHGYTRKL